MSLDFTGLETQYGLPAGLLTAVMKAESGGDPLAVSPTGAQGLFQFMPETAKQYGIDPLNPEQAADGAARMYSDLSKKYSGDLPSMLAAYNWGQGNVDKQGLVNAPTETQDYIKKVMGQLAPRPEMIAERGPVADSGQIMTDGQPDKRPSLDEIFAKDAKRPSLDEIFSDSSGKAPENGNNTSFLGEMLGNAKNAVQNAEDLATGNFDLGGGTVASPKTQSLADKIFTPGTGTPSPYETAGNILLNIRDNTSPGDWAAAVREKIGNNPAGKALGVIGGLNPAWNAIGTAVNRDVNPAISKVTGASPDTVALMELAASAFGLKSAGKVTDPLANAAKAVYQKVTAAKPADLTAADVASQAGAAYDSAAQKGGVLTPKVTDSFLADAKKVLPQTAAGKAVFGDSQTAQLLNRFNNLKGKPLSLAEAQELDEGLGDAIDSHFQNGRLSKEGKKILDIQDKFRSSIENASPSDVVGGKDGFDALSQARQLWSQSARMRDVEKIITRASSMDNPVTGIKTGFRNLLNNPSRIRGFSADERAAIKSAANTGIVTDALRLAGSRLGPIMAGAAGGATGGPLAGITAAGMEYLISSAARDAANRIQLRKANNVTRTIANGGKVRTKSYLPALTSIARGTPNIAAASALAALAQQGGRP